MRRLVWVLGAALLLLVVFIACGCSSAGQSDSASAGDVIRVPDVVSAMRTHDFKADYADDPKMAAIALHAYVDGALEASGLESDLVMDSSSTPDSQEPAAGSMVEAGSVVTVRIGIDE